MSEPARKYPSPRDLTEVDCLHKYVSINDGSGHEWFRGKALEHIGGSIYRFQVFKIGGRLLEAEMIVDLGQVAVAAVEDPSAA